MNVKGIDFSNLSLKDALDLAILVEEEAQERYEEFVHQMKTHDTGEAGEFFRFMAGNEAKHGAELTERRKRLFGDQPRSVKRSMLWDVEAPEYDEARMFMTPRQALEVALRCEEKAYAFFDAALPRLTEPDVRSLFEELREEEIEHQTLVKQQMAKLPAEEPADPEDYADGPVPQ